MLRHRLPAALLQVAECNASTDQRSVKVSLLPALNTDLRVHCDRTMSGIARTWLHTDARLLLHLGGSKARGRVPYLAKGKCQEQAKVPCDQVKPASITVRRHHKKTDSCMLERPVSGSTSQAAADAVWQGKAPELVAECRAGGEVRQLLANGLREGAEQRLAAESRNRDVAGDDPPAAHMMVFGAANKARPHHEPRSCCLSDHAALLRPTLRRKLRPQLGPLAASPVRQQGQTPMLDVIEAFRIECHVISYHA
jgi:hypothetical protein